MHDKQREVHSLPADIQNEMYEDRVFRAIVYPQYHSIKELFTDCFELIPIMVEQIIDCTLSHW